MRRQVAIILLCASSLCACKKEAPPPPPPEDPTLARIKVSAAGISLGAEPVLPSLEDNDKLPHALIDKLKERKKNFEKEHPTQTFIGRTEIDVEPGSSCRAVMNVVSAALVAGTWTFKLRSGNAEVEVPADKLRKEKEVDPKAPRPLWIGFHPDGTTELFKAPCLAPYETTQASGVPAVVKEMCGEAGDCFRETSVSCDEKTPFEKVLPALVALRGATKNMELAPPLYCDATIDLSEGPQDKGLNMKLTVREMYRGLKMNPPSPKARYKIKTAPVEGVDASRTEAYSAAVQGNKAAFASCYEVGLRENPNLQGRVLSRVEVNKQGGVVHVKTDEKTDMLDPFVARCVTLSLANVTFSASETRASFLSTVMFSPGG